MPAIIIEVKVRPNARSSSLMQHADGSWTAHVRSPPIDGRANEELVALVASHFRCPKSAVAIRSGAAGRRKRVRIEASESSTARGRRA